MPGAPPPIWSKPCLSGPSSESRTPSSIDVSTPSGDICPRTLLVTLPPSVRDSHAVHTPSRGWHVWARTASLSGWNDAVRAQNAAWAWASGTLARRAESTGAGGCWRASLAGPDKDEPETTGIWLRVTGGI
eukprot:412889-Rhodomonas_salina.2